MNPLIITVSQLNKYVKSLLESDTKISSVFIQGEISNFKLHTMSGHAYFSLKDDKALIRCVCFSRDFSKIKFMPCDGMKVLCQGSISLYEKDGNYQLYVVGIVPDGVGENALALEQLKEKLAAEGLFDAARKKKLPKYPKKIAVITAKQGAAIRDICNVTERRYPLCEIVICPVQVQGIFAASGITTMLKKVYAQNDIDVIIIARGGGASEDLNAFNDETLVRTMAMSNVPIISAVGHETDFTLCDYVADRRAPTPSAAAELSVPDIEEILKEISFISTALNSNVNRIITNYSLRLDYITKSNVLSDINNLFAPKFDKLNYLKKNMDTVFFEKISNYTERFVGLSAKLDTLSPIKTMLRGYSVAYSGEKVVKSSKDVESGDLIKLRTADGSIDCRVI